MKWLKQHCFYASMLFLAGCAHVDNNERAVGANHLDEGDAAEVDHQKRWIGSWSGESDAEGGMYRWFVKRDVDGTFFIHGRMYRDGKAISEAAEAGSWVVKGKLFITRTDSEFDGKELAPLADIGPHRWVVYTILSEANDSLVYRHSGSGKIYRVKRVNDDFKLPD